VDLAHHLGADQPLYGLQAQGINGDHQLHSRVEDMAAHYVKAIRAVQPEGPYLLGSWSMGVAIAYEMAQQLVAQGQEVGLLAMLDQGPFLPAEVPEDQASHLMETFGKHLPLSLDHLRQLGPDEQIAYVWEEARKAEWIYPDVTLPKFRHFVHILRTHTEAWRHYQPRIYPGRITLLRAVDEPRDNVDAADLGWGKLGAGGVEIYEVPGDHLSMIHEPHVQTLAAQLRACLEAVTNK
jgi:thioesterase domain-containing protein